MVAYDSQINVISKHLEYIYPLGLIAKTLFEEINYNNRLAVGRGEMSVTAAQMKPRILKAASLSQLHHKEWGISEARESPALGILYFLRLHSFSTKFSF